MPQILIHCYEEHTDEQKRGLVKDVTATVCEGANVKPFNVGIVFLRISRNERAICGRLMSDVEDYSKLPPQEIPWLLVQFQMFEGRSLDQKRKLVKGLTEDISRNFGAHPDRIQIIFSDMNRIDNAAGGLLNIDKK